MKWVLIFLLAWQAAAFEFSGRVAQIIDGDSLRIKFGTGEIRVRLFGIDAPEIKQRGGWAAKRLLEELTAGHKVRLKVVDVDKYGRLVAWAWANEINLNSMMIYLGWAWHYRRYSSDFSLAVAEIAARKARRGLWHDKTPQSPWMFRRHPDAAARAPYWLNRTGVRHRPGCRYYRHGAGRLTPKKQGRACAICRG